MRIAVVGAGGVDGVSGALLTVGGGKVHFVARGDHLEAIRRDGLAVRGGSGDVRVRPGPVIGLVVSVPPMSCCSAPNFETWRPPPN